MRRIHPFGNVFVNSGFQARDRRSRPLVDSREEAPLRKDSEAAVPPLGAAPQPRLREWTRSYCTLMLIFFGWASAFLGMVKVRTPSFSAALTFSVSTVGGSVKVRTKAPHTRS